jgi:hypothetical protein
MANDAEFTGSYLNIMESGYSTNLNTASFWGFNAAINVVRVMHYTSKPSSDSSIP